MTRWLLSVKDVFRLERQGYPVFDAEHPSRVTLRNKNAMRDETLTLVGKSPNHDAYIIEGELSAYWNGYLRSVV